MQFNKNRGFYQLIMLLSLVSTICFTLSLFFSDVLPDFWRGFLEGVAATGICLGVLHMLRCFIKKVNPFNGEPLSRP